MQATVQGKTWNPRFLYVGGRVALALVPALSLCPSLALCPSLSLILSLSIGMLSFKNGH